MKKSLHSLLLLAGIFLSAGHSFAADGTWIQTAAGPFDWSTTTNWSGGTVADGADFTAFFTPNITAAQTVNLDTARTIGNITFTDSTTNNNNLTISGANILTLDRTAGIPVIDVTQSNRTLTISSVISGSDGLQKSGAGVLVLSGTNDYTGGTVINGGQLSISADANLGDAAGSLTFNGGELYIAVTTTSARSVILNSVAGNQVLLQGNKSWTNSGAVTGTGGINFKATGNGGVNANLTSAGNTFNGALGIQGSGNNAITVTTNSLSDSVGAGNIVFGTGSNQTFKWNGSSALTLNNRQIELAAGSGTIFNATTTNAITINTDLVASGTGAKTLTLNAAAGPTNAFNGDIVNGSGTVAVTKTGTGEWTLGGTNTYTLNTTVSQGTLSLASTGQLLFDIDASGFNNSILGVVGGTEALVLDGTLMFDLASAGTTLGDFWNIVDVTNLTETYGSNFSVSSLNNGLFSETSSLWTISENGVTYEFSEALGQLTVTAIPEPRALLLGSLGILLLLRRRR